MKSCYNHINHHEIITGKGNSRSSLLSRIIIALFLIVMTGCQSSSRSYIAPSKTGIPTTEIKSSPTNTQIPLPTFTPINTSTPEPTATPSRTPTATPDSKPRATPAASGPFSEHSITKDSKTASGLFVQDIDSDGDIDLLGNKLFWWENDGDFVFSEHIIPTETNSSFVKGFDIDSDGDVDIVTYVDHDDNPDGNTGKLLWWENDGDQNFTPSLIINTTLISTNYSPVIVDLDQDGDGDLIYATIGHLYWCEFTDSGWVSHTILSSISSSFKGLEDIVPGDFDGDGDLDIVVPNDYYNPSLNYSYDALWFWENDGTTNFPTHFKIADGYAGNRDLKAVDFDDDGDLDLLSAGVGWLENQGDLEFVGHGIIYNSPYSVYPFDLEGDGDVDIYYLDDDLWLYLENLGTGDFQRRSMALVSSVRAIGDLDKDENIDLVVYDSSDSQSFVWLEYADVTPASLPFYDGFEDPYLGNSWENRLSERGVVSIQSETVITGTQSLHFDYTTAEIILYLDLAGEDQVDLSFVLGNEYEPVYEDGLYISDDNINWHLVMSRTITSTTQAYQYEIDLDEAADTNGLTFNDHFQVKFMLYGGTYCGYWLDEVEVYTPGDQFSTIFLPMVVRLEENP